MTILYKMLDNIYLEKVLKPWSITKNVTSIDKLANIVILQNQTPSALIVNTSPFPIPGHWILLIFDNKRHCTFFDSLGPSLPHQPLEITSFIKENSISIDFNLNQIQHIESSFCGFFCIAKIISFMLNEDHLTFSSHFSSKNLGANDAHVIKLIQSFSSYLLK